MWYRNITLNAMTRIALICLGYIKETEKMEFTVKREFIWEFLSVTNATVSIMKGIPNFAFQSFSKTFPNLKVKSVCEEGMP